MTDIDAYATEHLTPAQRAVLTTLRELVRAYAPGSQEVISRGSPAWQGRRLLAIVSRSKTHLTLAFARGAEFTDEHGLLDGVGKTTRHLKIKDPAAVPRAAIADYLRQAVALDSR
jgi:hypothetical protein